MEALGHLVPTHAMQVRLLATPLNARVLSRRLTREPHATQSRPPYARRRQRPGAPAAALSSWRSPLAPRRCGGFHIRVDLGAYPCNPCAATPTTCRCGPPPHHPLNFQTNPRNRKLHIGSLTTRKRPTLGMSSHGWLPGCLPGWLPAWLPGSLAVC